MSVKEYKIFTPTAQENWWFRWTWFQLDGTPSFTQYIDPSDLSATSGPMISEICKWTFPSPRRKPTGSLKLHPTSAGLLKIKSLDLPVYLKNIEFLYDGSHIKYEWRGAWSIPAYGGVPGSIIDQLTIEADNAVSSKLRDSLSSENLSMAETIGEYRETLDTLRYLTEIVGASALAAVGKRIPLSQMIVGTINKFSTASSRGMKVSKFNVSSLPLAWVISHLAVGPVLGMINSIQYQFSGLNDLTSTKNIGANHTAEKVLNDYVVDSTGLGWGFRYEVIANGTVSVKKKTSLLVKSKWGKPSFSIGNPLEWIWAATPLSFMVDWILHVNQLFSSLNDIPPDIEFGGYTKYELKMDLKFTTRLLDGQDNCVMSNSEGLLTHREVSRREFLEGVDLKKGVGFRFDPKLNLGKELTAASIFMLMLSRGRKS